MGVDLRLRRRSLRDLPEEFAVAKAVLIVLICHSMKSLDLGYRGDEVMWSMYWDVRNFGRLWKKMGGHYLKRIFWEGHIVKLNFVIF